MIVQWMTTRGDKIGKDFNCVIGRVALELAHIVNVAAVGVCTYIAMVYLFGDLLGFEDAKHSAPEVTVLNAALCYFERDASERVARAIVRVIPFATLEEETRQAEEEKENSEYIHSGGRKDDDANP